MDEAIELMEAAGVRLEVRLTIAAKALGWPRRALRKELERRGLPVMGKGQNSSVYAEDLRVLQQAREREAHDERQRREGSSA